MLRPVEAVDGVIPITPERGVRCQHALWEEDPLPQRPQVTEIPPVQPVVTADQRHRLVCPSCGTAPRAEWPTGVPAGALCAGAYHLSKRIPQGVLAALCGVSMGWGTVANLGQATVQVLAAPVATVRVDGQAQPIAYLDEMGWRDRRPRAWLWPAVTAGVTVCVSRQLRDGKVAQELRGERFWGYWVTDRGSADPWSPRGRRQLWWAHRRHDSEAMRTRGGSSRASGEALRVQAHQMFYWWHRVRDGTLASARFTSYRRPIRREVEWRLEAGQTCGVSKTERTCRERLKRCQSLWRVVRHPEVEPTNAAAERAIRPGVLWRKGSLGTQSPTARVLWKP